MVRQLKRFAKDIRQYAKEDLSCTNPEICREEASWLEDAAQCIEEMARQKAKEYKSPKEWIDKNWKMFVPEKYRYLV